jgi:hypothetical protein
VQWRARGDRSVGSEVEVGLHYRGAGLAVLGRQYKHEALVYNIFYHQGKSVSCGIES